MILDILELHEKIIGKLFRGTKVDNFLAAWMLTVRFLTFPFWCRFHEMKDYYFFLMPLMAAPIAYCMSGWLSVVLTVYATLLYYISFMED